MSKIRRDLPNDEYQAAVGANNPSAANVFATIADLTGGTVSADRLEHDVKYDEAGGILKGQAVYVSGASGTNILVKKADYSTEATSSKTLGLVTKDGVLNFQGTVITEGLLTGTGTDPLDTSMATIGDPIWLGDDGNLIYGLINKPYAPNHLVFIGIVTNVSATVGEIFVKVQNGFELDEIHDVDLKSNPPTDGQVLGYNAVTDLWEPLTIPGATPSGTQLLTGGASWSGTGMVFNVSALTYTIDGDYYSSAPQNVTLAAGDPSNPRFDAIVVDATGTVSVITGTPSANPIVPSIPGTQVLVQYVLVAAGATTPSVTNEFVYTDGSTPNWTPGSNLLTVFNPLSTTPTPFQGTECTYITALSASTSRFLKYTKPSGSILRSSFPFLSFRVQVLAGSSGRGLSVRLYNGLTYINAVNAASWGYSSTAVGTWQLVVIPLAAFGNNAITTVTEVRFLPQGTVVAATPFAFDDIKFQSGYGPQTNTATIDILDSGTVIGSTAKLNFIDGTNTTVTVTDDVPNNKIDVQIDAANTTLTSAGGSISLVNDGTGPSLAVKGLTAGSGIALAQNVGQTFVTISASGLVPYTGATTAVDLGAQTLTGSIINGTNSLRAVPSYTSSWVSSLGYTGNGINAQGDIILREWSTGAGKVHTIGLIPGLVYGASRSINFPDADATLVARVNGISANNNGDITIPALSTVALINSVSDLPAPSGGTITLAANTVYEFNTGTFNIGTNYLTVSDGTIIVGQSSFNTSIVYTGTGGAVRGTDVNFAARQIVFASPAGRALDFTNVAQTKNISLQNCAISSQTSASVITGYNIVFMAQTRFVSCVGGLNLVNNLGVALEFVVFNSTNSGTYITITPTATTTIKLSDCDFEINTGSTGINVTSTSIASGIIAACDFKGTAAVANRLVGVNGNTTGWNIAYGDNTGIAGIQFVDIEITSTATALGNSAGTYIDGVKGYALPIASYDQYATVMEARATALMTNALGTAVQVGIYDFTSAAIVGGLGTSNVGTNVAVQSNFIAITPNREYTGYYVKNIGTSTRTAIKLTLKIY